MLQRPYYFSAFEPFDYQKEVIDLLYNYDYINNLWPSVLLSGSVGSAKSALGAHWLISHCLRWRKARTFICRMGLPDLKKTIFHEIVEGGIIEALARNDLAKVESSLARILPHEINIKGLVTD